MIVLNEYEWAEEMIQSHSLGKKPYETLFRVAKYYIEKNYSKKEVRGMLDAFLLQCDPSSSLPKWAETLDIAADRAWKYRSIKIDSVVVTKPELSRINMLKSVQAKRLAFTLLCLAKYWDIVNPQCDHWVNSKDSDIMRMANINTSIRRQSLLYAALNDAGLIQFSKKIDNTNVRVCFEEPGETAVEVTDFRNLGYQYLMLCGNTSYITCQSCGVVVRKNTVVPKEFRQHGGRPQKYCKDCAVKINRNRTTKRCE